MHVLMRSAGSCRSGVGEARAASSHIPAGWGRKTRIAREENAILLVSYLYDRSAA